MSSQVSLKMRNKNTESEAKREACRRKIASIRNALGFFLTALWRKICTNKDESLLFFSFCHDKLMVAYVSADLVVNCNLWYKILGTAS